ncbi:WG repeat-containing protein [Paenibacillus silvisoli]|uniref:WG repeat-containing protein n=1 Tax=Paenibacillus silvisoli TaxID=3110539 RepID=UPI002805739F|nr:WG repeat-containing protein [Paenibacillus silvisoli]
MAANEQQLAQIALANMPSGAELMLINPSAAYAAVCAADLNGDRLQEIAAVYRLGSQLHLMVLEARNGVWEKTAEAKGPGYGVSRLSAMPVLRAGRNNLIVGWQINEQWSKLSVYEWTREGLRDVAPSGMSYSYLDVLDMPGDNGQDGKSELALWLQNSGESYRIEVLRWQGGSFEPAPDVYSYYYPHVVRYYERLVWRYPQYPLYWYCLADAQYRAGSPQPALVSVHQAMAFAQPTRETLLELEQSIRVALEPVRSQRQTGLFPASVKTMDGMKWGYIDSKGSMAVPPRFDDASDFQANGLAVVAERGKYGIINSSVQFVVPPKYDSIGQFSEHRAAVIDSQGFKLINESGTVLTNRAYPYIADMKGGRAYFYDNVKDSGGMDTTKYGYLDLQGNPVIPARYEEANDFHNNQALVKVKDKEYALIDPNGRTLHTYSPYVSVGSPGDGLLSFVKEAGGKAGYMDERGNVVIQPAFYVALPFEDGRAIVNTSDTYLNNYGVINKQGTYIVKPEYNDIRNLGSGRFAIGRAINKDQPYLGSNFAIADWDGRLLTDFVYTDVSDYKNGLASVTDAKQTFFIDTSGKPAPGYPRVDGSGSLTLEEGGLIKAFVDQRLSYLDRAGRVVWQQNTVIPLKPPYFVKEEKYKPNRDYLVYYPQVEGMADEAAKRSVNEKLREMSQVKPIPPDTKLEYSYTGDFEVAFFKNQLLQLELTGYNYPFGAAHGMPTRVYAKIDLVSGKMYELKDLFKPGSDYVKVLSDIVGKMIKEDPQYSYVFPDTYKGIRPDQPFFVTEDALHLYFEPYEIAPYAAGFPTFTIPFAEIRSLIDTNGAFWKSFH